MMASCLTEPIRADRYMRLDVVLTAAPLSTVTLDCTSFAYNSIKHHSKPCHFILDGTFTGQTNTTTGLIYFRGIRYADPPTGKLRWMAPVSPPSKHLGKVTATSFGFACIGTTQTDAGPTTSEDCLFGNVYIPIATTATSALPVLVFFHGGGFETGRSTKYPPENIVLSSAEPLIFVTFEYRLGQFGFLPGTPVHDNGVLNAGLLDQKAALQWVQTYIGKFGGDPRRVTIWGQSAGAASVLYHMIGDGGTNTNLFNQAIMDSPPLLSLLSYNDPAVENLFTQFASLAGCAKKATSASTMSCLRAASTAKLATAGSKLLLNLTSSLYPLGPIADGSYIQERPVDALQNGNFVRVPVLSGSNTDEGANWSAELTNPAANTSSPKATETTVYNFLAGQYGPFTNTSFQQAVTMYYPLADYNGSVSLQGQQMYGEMRYICAAMLVAGAVHDVGLSSYQYHWDNPNLGSTHGDELDAFFNGAEVFDPADEALVQVMRGYWTSFATGGTPVAAGGIAWPAADDSDGSPRLLLHPGNVTAEEVNDVLRERCAFWYGLSDELST
ncbi:Carboxylic ester hydrolase [Mycena sanguinolenta]|uniref:Carboxylic ester hydrolase n=1 Tax=Mycena sanguinolenta TaxID=230812 RepID=A0A8H7D4V0_9AGAR|nr:Carboxylic ester hydrolase [Mycena sanguinolenta]